MNNYQKQNKTPGYFNCKNETVLMLKCGQIFFSLSNTNHKVYVIWLKFYPRQGKNLALQSWSKESVRRINFILLYIFYILYVLYIYFYNIWLYFIVYIFGLYLCFKWHYLYDRLCGYFANTFLRQKRNMYLPKSSCHINHNLHLNDLRLLL